MRKKVGIHRPHLGFCLPSMLFHTIATPQHFNHRNNLRSQLTHLIIYNCNWFSSNVKYLFNSTLWGCNTCEGSEIYFLSIEIWNTGCTCDIFGGKANRYATMPILSNISKSSMYLDANFFFLIKPHHTLHR